MVLQFKNENSNHIMWPQMSNLPSRLLGLFDLERGIAQTFGVLSTIWKPHKLAAVERFTLEGTTHSSWALCFLGSEESSINLVCILQTIKTNWHISQHLCQPTRLCPRTANESQLKSVDSSWFSYRVKHFQNSALCFVHSSWCFTSVTTRTVCVCVYSLDSWTCTSARPNMIASADRQGFKHRRAVTSSAFSWFNLMAF